MNSLFWQGSESRFVFTFRDKSSIPLTCQLYSFTAYVPVQSNLHPACNLFHCLSACRIWPWQINMHLQIQLAVWKLPKEYLIANYTVSPFYQIAKKQ